MRPQLALAAMGVVVATAGMATGSPLRSVGVPHWRGPVLLDNTVGVDEPRIAYGPGGVLYAIASLNDGQHPTAAVFRSTDDGRHFTQRGVLPLQDQPSIDLDIVVLPSGRVVASELDGRAFSVRTAVSDDGGASWTNSVGMTADMDRQWLAAGPGDRVYTVWHNFVSGLTAQEMLVQTSTDGGATFGAPVPVAPAGSPAFEDLTCGDSTGPSSIAVDPRTGRIYVSFATRTSSIGGGCGQATSAEGPRFNVVPSTRLWVASSPDGSPGSWTDQLVVDTSATNRPIALQYAPLTVMPDGTVALSYTEGRGDDDYVSDIRVVTSHDHGTHWSTPLIVPSSMPALFPLVGGDDRGNLHVAYLHANGTDQSAKWYPVVATLHAGGVIATQQISTFPSHIGSPASMSAACGTGPTSGLQQALLCNRYLDDFGMAVRPDGHLAVIWPAPFAAKGGHIDGVYVATASLHH